MFVACEGERDSIRLRIPGGDGGSSTPLAADASMREFGGTSTNVLSTNSLKPIVFDLVVAQPVGKNTLCAVRPSTQSVRGKKGGRPSKPRRPKV